MRMSQLFTKQNQLSLDFLKNVRMRYCLCALDLKIYIFCQLALFLESQFVHIQMYVYVGNTVLVVELKNNPQHKKKFKDICDKNVVQIVRKLNIMKESKLILGLSLPII